MDTIYLDLLEHKEVRSNLSALRAKLRAGIEEAYNKEHVSTFVQEHEAFVLDLLAEEDAKTRKNAALLLGDISYQNGAQALYDAYEKENTLFVKSAYLDALSQMDIADKLPQIKQQIEKLAAEDVTEENRKHIDEELRALRKIVIRYEGISKHKFDRKQTHNRVLLFCNKNGRETVRRMTGGKVHPLGVMVETDDLVPLMQVRTYREMLFPIEGGKLTDSEPRAAAQALCKHFVALCEKYHHENMPFYFRVECKAPMTLEQKSTFAKRLGSELERLSGGRLINSVGDYEVELRLIANKEGRFFPCLKFYTLRDMRFSYRKNVISVSIHPSLAALMMELAAPYLKEGAQVMDPFCGVGTMLIERDIRVPAGDKYGTDTFGEAIDKARENASLAGEQIHYIHRDFFDFHHDYLFDEIVTNMPVRGKMTREELDRFYTRFFDKALEILRKNAIIVMYTQEVGFVKKQLRLRKEYVLHQEYCMQDKKGFYLLVIGVRE